jgi:hypothetical protein
MMQMRTKPHSPLKVLEEQLPLPKRSYICAIHVDGVLRYIGKGSNGRIYAHMKEVRQRLTRKFKLKNVSPFFQRKLTEAVMKGAVIEEITRHLVRRSEMSEVWGKPEVPSVCSKRRT